MPARTPYIKYFVQLTAVFVGGLVGCSTVPGGQANSSDLTATISALQPWDYTAAYSKSAWEQMLEAAALVQSSPPEEVEAALGRVARAHDADPVAMAGKVMVLLRCVFDLPSHSTDTNALRAGAWIGKPGDDNGDGTFNAGWPVVWTEKGPTLAAGYEGYIGPTFHPEREFTWLRTRYPFRDARKELERLRSQR